MKLDDGAVFPHTSLVHKPDSKPFQCNDNTLDTAGLKADSEIKNGNQNRTLCDLRRCEGDADRPTFENKDGDGLWKRFDHDCSMSVHNFGNVNLNKVQDSLIPHAIPPNDQSFFEKGIHFYTDKIVNECDLPELIVCFKEPIYHVVKDICIDEGVPSMDKILVESGKDGHNGIYNFPTSDSDNKIELHEQNVAVDLTIPKEKFFSAEEDFNLDGNNQCDCKSLYQTSEDNIDDKGQIAHNAAKQNVMPEQVGDLGSKNSLPELLKFGGNESELGSFQIGRDEAILASAPLVSMAEESNNGSFVTHGSHAESGSITFHFGSSTPVSSQEEASENGEHEKPFETHTLSRLEDGISDDGLTTSSQVRNGHGETSFSSAGPLSGVITYSGPIAFSGSLSIRSDSSTTSTRSFAFPVLQSEWNSSPVRMAKAERRNFRKSRRWRQGLLCCRF